MGRRPHEPNDKDRQIVETMAGYGIKQIDIARVIGVTMHLLHKYYMEEIETGAAKANMKVAQSLFEKALANDKGSVTACIFWLKCRAQWVEHSRSLEQQQNQPVPEPEDKLPHGKKAQLKLAAATAGGADTEWADDLDVEPSVN
jgi:hypothetical protein